MRSITVTTATPIVLTAGDSNSIEVPFTIGAIPGAGGTLAVEFQIVKDSTTWFAWTPGTVSAATADLLMGPVYAVRFTAAIANGVVEVNQ